MAGTEEMPESTAMQEYNNSAKEIWNNLYWRKGKDPNRPWEFGNPTGKSPGPLLNALKGKLPACNGSCTATNMVYYRDTSYDPKNISYYENGNPVYNVAFVVTYDQMTTLCGPYSCVKR
jgi:hypothetical protein